MMACNQSEKWYIENMKTKSLILFKNCKNITELSLKLEFLFSNGLVLSKQNVSRTDFDNFSEFIPFIARYANQKFDEFINQVKF